MESGRRFTLDASLPEIYAAPVVLGVRPRSTVTVSLNENTTMAVMDSKNHDTIKKVFRS